MANNRLWLLHRPSKRAVLLGKRMGMGWYEALSSKTLQKFYDFLEDEHFVTMDDFELLIEDQERVTASVLRDDWVICDFETFKGPGQS